MDIVYEVLALVSLGDTISAKLFTATFEQVFRKLDWEGQGFNIG